MLIQEYSQKSSGGLLANIFWGFPLILGHCFHAFYGFNGLADMLQVEWVTESPKVKTPSIQQLLHWPLLQFFRLPNTSVKLVFLIWDCTYFGHRFRHQK